MFISVILFLSHKCFHCFLCTVRVTFDFLTKKFNNFRHTRVSELKVITRQLIYNFILRVMIKIIDSIIWIYNKSTI